MLETLKFVQGAVARKDFVPTLQHFRIKDGIICGYNGNIALSSPIDLDLDVCPRAVPFVKAIQTCQETIQLHITPAGKLGVKSGKFKAFIECVQEEFPDISPQGVYVDLAPGLIATLKQLAPFIAEDASRPWARGILLRSQSAFATNNVVVIEKWLGSPFPVEVNIPRMAVMELVRIGDDPTHLQMDENSVTFHYEGGRWLRTQLYSTQWPDLAPILNRESTPTPIPETLWETLEELKPFVDEVGRVFLSAGSIATHEQEGIGAVIEIPELTSVGIFNHEQLGLLHSVATSIDLSGYPKPCLFFGDKLRGAIVGVRA